MLKPGDRAPNFELPNADLDMLSSNDYIGKKPLVIYFYPKDDTPGCTMEALDFSDLYEEFSALGAEVFGVSRDSCISHGDFRDKHGLNIQLLADIEGVMCDAYGVWQEREAHGEKRMLVVRSTFVVDSDGVIRHALYDIKPKGHASEVLELVKGL